MMKLYGVLCCVVFAGCVAAPPRGSAPENRADFGSVSQAPLPGTASESAALSDRHRAAPAPALLTLTLDEALLLALENNRALRIQRIAPEIRQTVEQEAASVFDSLLSADIAESRQHDASRPGLPGVDGEGTHIGLGLSGRHSPGTRWELGLESDRVLRDGEDERHSARLGATVTQPLRRGAGRAANLAELRQARLDTRMSEFELRGVAESLAAQVESVYLDCILAERRQGIVEASLRLAERQREETRQRIRVGGLPATELAAAEAEVAVRQEALINARSAQETLRVRLARLVQPERLAWPDPKVSAKEDGPPPVDAIEPLETHLASAWRARPDLNQARLLAQRGDLDLVRTANGLLPRMDLFVRLGKSGYADAFGGAFEEMGGDAYDAALGVAVEWPVGNRAARARHRRSQWAREQTEESLRNIEDLVREDVHIAHLEARRARQQVDATAATRTLQEEKLRAETAKYAAGQSTALFVAQAQRDLLVAQVAEAESATRHRKALTDLYRLDGSLLDRRGIRTPALDRRPRPIPPALRRW